jgi:hypothetical protein
VTTPRQEVGELGAVRLVDVKPSQRSIDATLKSKSTMITSLGIGNVDRFIVVDIIL